MTTHRGASDDTRLAGFPAFVRELDATLSVHSQYVLWGLGIVQIHRYRRRALDHLEAEHPGALDALRGGGHYVPE